MKLKSTLLLSFILSCTQSSWAQKEELAQQYIQKYKDIAIAEQIRTGIPAAIKLAQGIYETGAGKSELAQNANNHFGIKCKATWKGDTYTYTDDRKDECFRKYNDDITSYKDHSDFLRNNPRYSNLFTYSMEDYKSWSHGLKKAGYATNPQYAYKLIETIEKFNLSQYTLIALQKETAPQAEVMYASATQEKLAAPIVETITKDEPITATEKEYYITTKLNNLKGFWAPKGAMLLEYAIKNKIRYSKLLEMNELPDAPLEAEMFIYLEKKLIKGIEETTTVAEEETLLQISQRTGVALAQLQVMNKLVPGVEPKAGSLIYLQQIAPNAPEVYIPSKTVSNTPNKREINQENNYIIVNKNNTDAVATAVTKIENTEEEKIIIEKRPKAVEEMPTTKVSEEPIVTTRAKDNIETEAQNTSLVASNVVKKEATKTAPKAAPEEDLSHLTPYERLKRHMDKQTSSEETSFYETSLKELSADQPSDAVTNTAVVAKHTETPSASPKKTSNTTTNREPKYHTVRKGETLSAIATKYKVSVKQLQDWNKVSPKTLQAGKKLRVSK